MAEEVIWSRHVKPCFSPKWKFYDAHETVLFEKKKLNDARDARFCKKARMNKQKRKGCTVAACRDPLVCHSFLGRWSYFCYGARLAATQQHPNSHPNTMFSHHTPTPFAKYLPALCFTLSPAKTPYFDNLHDYFYTIKPIRLSFCAIYLATPPFKIQGLDEKNG